MINLNVKNWDPRAKVVAALAVVLLLWGGWYAVQARSEDWVPRSFRNLESGRVQVTNNSGRNITLQVKMASQTLQWSSGFRGAGPKTINDHVILFVSNRNTNHAFSAKSLRAPVDVAFFDATGQLMEIQRMNPGNTTHAPRNVYRYALQAKAGYFDQQGISAGRSRLIVNSIQTVR